MTVRAKPGSRTETVAVSHDDAGRPELVVRVRAKAVAGAANTAVTKAVARALGLRPRQVRLVRGPKSRAKVLAVDAPDEVVVAALAALPAETVT